LAGYGDNVLTERDARNSSVSDEASPMPMRAAPATNF
jgi:hypothetical protein